LLRQRGQALKAVEAADILVEAALVGVAAAAVSAVATLVVPAWEASTGVAFAQRQLSQAVVHVLAATGISVV
jgi:hypothetical protein